MMHSLYNTKKMKSTQVNWILSVDNSGYQ